MADINKDKLVPQIRFKGYTDAWEQRAWVDTVDISTKMVDPKTGQYDKLPHIGTGNIESFTGQLFDNIKTVREDNLTSGKFHFHSGDIIYGKIRPNLGKYFLASFEGLCSADAYVLNSKNGLEQCFLFMILQYKAFYDYSISVSQRTKMPKINRDELNQFKFNAPCQKEQTAISNFFRSLDNSLTLHKRKLMKLKELKRGYLQMMFPQCGENVPRLRFKGFTDTWQEQRLGDLGETYTGLSGKTKDDFGHGGAEFVIYKNVFANTFSDIHQTEPIGIDTTQNEVKYGDLLFTTSSETPEEVGMASVWLDDRPNVYLNSFCFGYRPQNALDPYFSAFLLRSPKVRENFVLLAQGISRYNISKTKAMDMTVFLPSHDEQKKIGSFFRTLDTQITAHAQKLEQLKKLKSAYLQKMFI